MTRWPNPWGDEVVYVTLEELASCVAGLGEPCLSLSDNRTFTMTEATTLAAWRQHGERLDAYILPCPSGYHCIGVRYGAKAHQYLSPHGDQAKIRALLRAKGRSA